MDLTYQEPAEGILKNNDWGDSKEYKIACSCGADDHNHTVFVEADQYDISVTIYTRSRSDWRVNRFRKIWQLLTKGYVEQEVSISLTSQQALNYADTLKNAMEDIKKFKKSSTL